MNNNFKIQREHSTVLLHILQGKYPAPKFINFYAATDFLEVAVNNCIDEILLNLGLLQEEIQRKAYLEHLGLRFSDLIFDYDIDFLFEHFEKYDENPELFPYFENPELIRILEMPLEADLYAEDFETWYYYKRLHRQFILFEFERRLHELLRLLKILLSPPLKENEQIKMKLTANQYVILLDLLGFLTLMEDRSAAQVARILHLLTGLHPKNLEAALRNLDLQGDAVPDCFRKAWTSVLELLETHKIKL